MPQFAQILLVFLIFLPLILARPEISTNIGDSLVLVPHGEDPQLSKNKVIIPQVHDGIQPPLPCVIAESGMHENGQTFTKGNFHYVCKNGTAEVIACVADDSSVIQIGRTFLKNGIRHKCIVKEDTVTYEQKSTCFENGVHYDVGESYKNGSFKLICKENGIAIAGCFIQNQTTEVIMLGESRILGNHKHSCELLDGGKIRYTVNLLGCRRDEKMYAEGQIWNEKHIRYQCMDTGNPRVLGCVDESGLFIDLGRDILMEEIVHRCYRINSTTFYHRFHCSGKSLTECINNAPTPRQT